MSLYALLLMLLARESTSIATTMPRGLAAIEAIVDVVGPDDRATARLLLVWSWSESRWDACAEGDHGRAIGVMQVHGAKEARCDAREGACDELETLAATAEKAPPIRHFLRMALDRAIPAGEPTGSAIGFWPAASPEPRPDHVEQPTADVSETRAPRAARASRPRTRKLPEVLEDHAAVDGIQMSTESEQADDQEELEQLDDEAVAATPPVPRFVGPFKALGTDGRPKWTGRDEAKGRDFLLKFPGAHSLVDATGAVIVTREQLRAEKKVA